MITIASKPTLCINGCNKRIHCRKVCKNCYKKIHYEESERERRGAIKHENYPLFTVIIQKDKYARIKIGEGNGAKDWMPHHSLKDFLKVQSAVKERSTIDWLQANKGAAEIHMMELAECIYDAINESKPIKLLANQWHIPYSDKIDLTDLVGEMKSITKGKIPIEEQHMTMAKIEVATVMCARVSYTTVDHDLNTWSYEKYLKKYHDMKNAIPITHNSSPFEHCNKAMNTAEYNGSVRRMLNANGKVILDERGWVDNFRGFISLRKQIELQDGRAKNANRDFPLN